MSEDQVSIVRTPHSKERPYFSMARTSAQDERLSWEARGVLAYLLSKPDDWQVQIKDLQQQCGRDKVRYILKELVDAQYLTVKQEHNPETGHFLRNVYKVYETPFTEKPSTVNPPHTYKRDVDSVKKQPKPTHKKDYSQHDTLIQAWCEGSGIDVDKMGATMTDGTRRKVAEKMLAWKIPPTPEEVRQVVALKRRKGMDYEFRYLLDDIPTVRAKRHLELNGGVEGRRGLRPEDKISYYLPPRGEQS